MTSASFHVRHDLTPSAARDALLLLRLGPMIDGADLMAQARARDLELGRRQSADKVLASLRDLGLIRRPLRGRPDGLALTPLGAAVAEIAVRDDLLFAELVHLRYWWLWTPEHGGPAFAWSYHTVTTMLWEGAPTPVDPDRLVAAVLAAAEQGFGTRGVSFSRSSLLGILHWLRALSPPCIIRGHFCCRPACPPEALLLALEGLQHASGQAIGMPLRLDRATRLRACRALLLDEEAFDDMLSQAEEAKALVRLNGGGRDAVVLSQSAYRGLISTEGES
jgi:hypothetical protein